MTSHSDTAATDNDRAAVVDTVATVGDGIADGAIATVGTVVTVTVGDGVGEGAVATVTNPDDATNAAGGNHP